MRLLVYNRKSGLVSHFGVEVFLEMLHADENVSLHDYLAGDAPRLTARDHVVTAGGDGTLSAVVETLLASGRPARELPLIFIVPGGSSNSVARSLGLSFHPGGWRRYLSAYREVLLDVGRAAGKPFLLCVSAGVSARAVAGAEKYRGKGRSLPYYVVASLVALLKYHKVTASNASVLHQGPEVIIANMPVFGGLFKLPHVSPSDGLLDVFRPGPLNMGAWYAARPYRGISSRVSHVVVEGEGIYELDGEPGGPLPVRVAAEPARIRVALPAGG
ncbi:MAG: hypothetical protein JW909_01000 [Planctomycetes bacterium]|nr:hypothetical protein [Planctomycetota bacterium]